MFHKKRPHVPVHCVNSDSSKTLEQIRRTNDEYSVLPQRQDLPLEVET